MNNPFSLDFGTEPNLYIPRTEEQNKIINTFNSEIPSTHMYLLLGARGSVLFVKLIEAPTIRLNEAV